MTTTPIHIEQGGPELINRLEHLWLALRDFHADISPRIHARIGHKTFSQRRAELDGILNLHIQIATLHDQQIGCCVSSARNPETGEINFVYVADEHRSTGIGSEMIRNATQKLTQFGAQHITLTTAPENPRAIALYERLGFVPDELIMRLSTQP